MAAVERSEEEWINANEFSRRAGFSVYRLLKLAALGQVRTLAIPGHSASYAAADVQKVCGEVNPIPVQTQE